LNTSLALRAMICVDALLMAVGHVPIIRVIFTNFPVGAYFLFATVVYVLGGVFVVANKLLRFSNYSLIILAIVDNVLLVYTRTMPNVIFKRVFPWTWSWFPPGTVQICIGQAILVVLCTILLLKPGLQTQKPIPPVTLVSKVQ
jgi:hypothetical protein